MTAMSACSSGASGVVLAEGRLSSPSRVSTVPMSPVRTSSPRNPAASRYAVVVLPLVPVIPKVCKDSAGLPYTALATAPRVARGSGTTRMGTLRWSLPCRASSMSAAPALSVTTATAPAPTAALANVAPWTLAPGRAAYRSPGRTVRESRVTPVTGPSAGASGAGVPSSRATSSSDSADWP